MLDKIKDFLNPKRICERQKCVFRNKHVSVCCDSDSRYVEDSVYAIRAVAVAATAELPTCVNCGRVKDITNVSPYGSIQSLTVPRERHRQLQQKGWFLI